MLGKDFFRRNVVEVSKDLLGCFLVREKNQNMVVGKIVETEAYCGEDDPACHAFGGKTDRNKIMYGEPGHAYVYLIYGVHELLNFVTGKKGIPEAVLVRAIEPIDGVEQMKKNREVDDLKELTNGPGKLTEALSVSLKHNGLKITDKNNELYLKKGEEISSEEISRSKRIGVDDDSLLRFFITKNDFVSC